MSAMKVAGVAALTAATLLAVGMWGFIWLVVATAPAMWEQGAAYVWILINIMGFALIGWLLLKRDRLRRASLPPF